ncbi:hypothetical protein PPERSA_06605 [Pseudocohnilembus persalinus]|uniref:Uncharacterized protein n=1 Tax=Pseudocohnilembus persalinus TaxID=266149 RepID=A0A0V0QRS1_PSEPJ|nr:hypothetical protein PPERSA_06605 [Pseudocohnilembus persalinus]|eukprot:KRX04971.1 hypothetical protein PPERSA_06605 [Pseudocohnilembus persalinus]
MVSQQDVQSFNSYCQIILSNQDFDKVQEAQKILVEFLQNFQNFNIIKQIVYNTDQNNFKTIFVICELLQKIVQKSEQFKEGFKNVQQFAQQNVQDQQQLQEFQSQNENLITFGLKIFDFSVQNIGNYNETQGYLKYRKIMLQYQSFCIHEIIGCDLHLLANFLGLNEEIRKQKNNQKIIEQCLKLLESCVNFQFNISYYDFELDSDLKEQNTPIFFPDKVVEQFSNIHLLELLFVNNIQMIQDGNELSVILTKCLAKIASCKLYLIDGKENKKQFTFTLFKYISLTLQKIIEIGAQVRDLAEQEITIVILELASRFINNATLTKIRKFQELHNFFQCLQQFTILVINTTKIHLKNDSIPTIIDIYGKMVKQSLDQKLDDGVRQQLQNYVREIFQQFIARVQQVEDIVEDIDIKSSKFMKNVLKDYFTDFYSMLAQSLPQNLQIFANFFSECIKNYIDIFNQQNTKYLKILQQCLILCFGFITNIILQNQTLEFMFNYSNHGQNQDQLQIIAKILSDALILIDFLNQKFQENAQFYNQHFEMTLLIFSEEFMDTTLGQSYQSYEMFSEAQNIGFKLINNILKFFPKKSNVMEISNIFFDKIEKSIMYEDQLYQNKVAKNENQQQQQSPLIKYILKISKNLICRLKNNLSRSEFKQLQMVQKFQSLLLNLADQTFDKNYFLKQRIILFEIISYIMFDDLCDAYINNIIELVAKISFMNKNTQDKSLQQKNIIKFMYDCSGIVNIIDVPTIFKLTLKRINPLLKTLYTPEIFQNQELIIPSLKLMKAITYNRAINISHYTFTGLQYELFNDFAQYIIALITKNQPII